MTELNIDLRHHILLNEHQHHAEEIYAQGPDFNKSHEAGLHSTMNRVKGLVLSRPWDPLMQTVKQR